MIFFTFFMNKKYFTLRELHKKHTNAKMLKKDFILNFKRRTDKKDAQRYPK